MTPMARIVRKAALAATCAAAVVHGGCDLELKPFVEPSDGGRPLPSLDAGADVATLEPLDATSPADTAPLEAAPPDAPLAGKRIFVTSTLMNGMIGGVLGADARCKAAAEKLGGNFVAWLSVANSPALGRIVSDGPWLLVDRQTRVFGSRAALADGKPLAAIDRDESGRRVENDFVWTGTGKGGGVSTSNCSEFTSGSVGTAGTVGRVGVNDERWTQDTIRVCADLARLYCIEP
jgi:hypothetical protein